uniref:HIG1 domain-containing protein n=1 Tax=Phytophthora ramorum TaxID=164328 RepID=H3GHI7_PHYRM
MHKSAHDFDEAKRHKDAISRDAYVSGLKAGAWASLAMGAAVYGANAYHRGFRTRLGVSGKWALVVSAYLAGFAIVAENRLLVGARNPEQYMASLDPSFVEVRRVTSHLPLHKRAANFVYDHPYRSLTTVGVPLVGSIFAYQTTNHGINRSQQIMHTRIYGQAAVAVLLLGSMAFHDYMAKRGRFEEDEDDTPKIQELTV